MRELKHGFLSRQPLVVNIYQQLVCSYTPAVDRDQLLEKMDNLLSSSLRHLNVGLYLLAESFVIHWHVFPFIALVFIFIHGIEYVSWPRLQPLTDVIYYEGPGFRSAHHGKGLGLPLDKVKNAAVAQVDAIEQHRRAKSKKLDEIEMGTKRVD